jgi:hypothetical protein
MKTDEINRGGGVSSGAESPSVGSGSDICLTLKLSREAEPLEVPLVQTDSITPVSGLVGSSALLSSFSYSAILLSEEISEHGERFTKINDILIPVSPERLGEILNQYIIQKKVEGKPVSALFA